MLTKDDLEQIGKLINSSLDQKLEPINKHLATVDTKLATLNAKIEATEAHLAAKIDKVQETVDIVQNVVVEDHVKLEKRVSRLEDHLGLSHHG